MDMQGKLCYSEVIWDLGNTCSTKNMASKRNRTGSELENAETSKKKYTGSATYKVAFKSEWKFLHPVEVVKSDIYKFHCIPCGKNLSCHHQGLKVKRCQRSL